MISAGASFARARVRLTPAQSLTLGFASLTTVGALLLRLPIASQQGTTQPLVDAFFTATSAVTTTGLVVVDTGSYYSLFGQAVILALFQIGGLGYMMFIAFLALLMGRRLSLGAGVALEESLAGFPASEYREFVALVFRYTLLFEAIGAAVLSVFWLRYFPPARAIYLGLFHSVSAFSTAGFGLFPDSFVRHRDSVVINVVIALVTIAGATGFFVLRDVARFVAARATGRRQGLSLHSKLTLVVSGASMALGSAAIFAAEPSSVAGARLGQRFATATFQGLSASTTTGFNSVDLGALTATTLWILTVVMFVGASPGGTGGGIKTTTLAVLSSAVVALLRGDREATAFGRRLSDETVRRSLAIALLAAALVTLDTLVLTATERQPFLSLLFEVVSAFATVGLSTGITGNLSSTGRIILSLTMLIGRLGPLAIGFALLARPNGARLRWAKETVFVG